MTEIKSQIRVLVVDDDEDQLVLVQRTLKRHGFEVFTYHSSLGVSNQVRTTTPDLVLLDVNIPALSGDKVLALARNQARTTTRFILYSSADESRLRSLALTSGADGYLSKSVQGEALAKKLTSLYHNGRQTAVGA